jgi:glutamine---fructose-6-phosphate transaminase (isomerizing)
MCWIFAYNGKQNAVPHLIKWLRNLEYRGYDSAWLIGISHDGKVMFEKAVGKVANLATKVEKNHSEDTTVYTTWIAHTRWATHGGVTEANCHPHISQNKRFFVVHNGIIENYHELKKWLEASGTIFYSQTDTEVIANLIEKEYETDLKTTIEKVIKKMIWAYAIAVIDTQNPNQIIGFKLGSPLIVGEDTEGIFISSDINALSSVAQSYVILEDYEMVVIENGTFQVFSSGKEVSKNSEQITEKKETSDIGTFSCFTEKEIFDIPNVLENVFSGRIKFDEKTISNETLSQLNEQEIDRIEMIASGSSYFAGYTGAYYFKELAGIPATVTISSEFLYDTFIPDSKTLYIFLSQSWETADVRESLRIVKEKWCMTFGIVNVVGSTIARMSDMGLFSHAGVEVWVASTKNVVAQIGVLLIMALSLGSKRNLQHQVLRSTIEELSGLQNTVLKALMNNNKIKEIAQKYSQYNDIFFLWRNLLYPVAWECSLKCKELSYAHTESYSTWELKHWPLALVWPNFPTVFLNTKGKFSHKNASNIQEVKARNGKVLGIVTAGDTDTHLYDDIIELPETSEILAPFIILPVMYLFSLYFAQALGREIDKPRNLAKSVTVE